MITMRRSLAFGLGGLALAFVVARIAVPFATPGYVEPDAKPISQPLPGAVPTNVGISTSHAERDQADECAGGAGPIVEPLKPLGSPQSWFEDSDYPLTAMRQGQEGVTAVELMIDAQGRVMACGLAGPSGHLALDQRGCEVFRTRARFKPARDERGCAVPASYRTRIRWQIAD